MIHETALIDASAKIGRHVQIGAYSIIGANVTIADHCWIGPHVVINGPTVLGEHSRVYQFSSLGEAPQDLKYAGEPTRLEIGARNVIREFVTMNRGTVSGNGVTRIGDDNLIMAYCHIAHDCVVGNHTIFANAASLAGHVTVGDHATLGGFTLVHQFTRIGEKAFSGMGSNISQDIPPYSIVAGDRARTAGINKIGLRRKGFSDDLISALHKSFKLLVKSKTPQQQAIESLQDLIEQYPEVASFASFIQNSKRGIAR